MGKYGSNPKKQNKVREIQKELEKEFLFCSRMKFNFSFFDDSQKAGQSFEDWDAKTGPTSLLGLLKGLREFSMESLRHWVTTKAGGGKKYAHYTQGFPEKSDFTRPNNISSQVTWGRFRLSKRGRLIGFTISDKVSQDSVTIKGETYSLDSNTFYIVFFDESHNFYK